MTIRALDWKNLIRCFSLALLLMSGLAIGEAAAEESDTKQLKVDFNASFFRYDATDVYCELCYSLPDSALSYRFEEGRFLGELYMAVEVRNKTKSYFAQEWILENISDSAVTKYTNDINGIKTFLLPPGTYDISIVLIDLAHRDKRDTIVAPMLVPSFPDDRVGLSSICLTSMLRHHVPVLDTAINPAYIKNSFVVIPNPSLMYGGTMPRLTLYAEVYNALKLMPEGFVQRTTISSSAGHKVYEKNTEHTSAADGQVLHASIAIDTLPSGVYNVNIEILDRETKTMQVQNGSRFYVLNPERPPLPEQVAVISELFAKSEFATMTHEQLQTALGQFKIIASADELAIIDGLKDDRAIALFLFQQWQARDLDKETLVNEEWEEFKRNVEYANTYYSSLLHEEGWRSDRGRVLLRYGRPENIQSFHFQQNARPHEIWTYTQIQGGVQFVFVDIGSYGNFSQVHSTAQEEVSVANWRERFVDIMRDNQFDGNAIRN